MSLLNEKFLWLFYFEKSEAREGQRERERLTDGVQDLSRSSKRHSVENVRLVTLVTLIRHEHCLSCVILLYNSLQTVLWLQ